VNLFNNQHGRGEVMIEDDDAATMMDGDDNDYEQ
jgi:hypothetical protein